MKNLQQGFKASLIGCFTPAFFDNFKPPLKYYLSFLENLHSKFLSCLSDTGTIDAGLNRWTS
jgi:hypothetical protein